MSPSQWDWNQDIERVTLDDGMIYTDDIFGIEIETIPANPEEMMFRVGFDENNIQCFTDNLFIANNLNSGPNPATSVYIGGNNTTPNLGELGRMQIHLETRASVSGICTTDNKDFNLSISGPEGLIFDNIYEPINITTLFTEDSNLGFQVGITDESFSETLQPINFEFTDIENGNIINIPKSLYIDQLNGGICTTSSPYGFHLPILLMPEVEGEFLTYSIFGQFLNQDSLFCGISNFSIEIIDQSGLLNIRPHNFDPEYISIENILPEDTTSYSLVVGFPEGVDSGEYPVDIIVTNNNSGLSSTDEIIITVE